MKTGIEIIAEERIRQIEQEGYTFEHDDNHIEEELALAAACYACPEIRRDYDSDNLPCLWPFEAEYWKPSDAPLEAGSTFEGRIRELAKAGACIAAEIDRIQRAIS